MEQTQFLLDLNKFITEHPHYIKNEGLTEQLPSEDRTVHGIHDPNGDYERISISIAKIA